MGDLAAWGVPVDNASYLKCATIGVLARASSVGPFV